MSAVIRIVGWALLHFIWQAAAIAAVVAVVLRSARAASPHGRYIVACGGLAAMVVTPFVTASIIATRTAAPSPEVRRSQFSIVTSQDGPAAARLDRAAARTNVAAAERARLDAIPFVVVPLWLAGATLLLVRRGTEWHRLRQAHVAALRLGPSPWQRRAEHLADCLGLRQAFQVIELAHIDVPMVVGWLKPAIMLPIAMCTQMPREHVEAVLAHELAHIYRRDYVVNLLQIVAEAVLFYHPAVWWISARIRVERELCCDDVAVRVCGDRMMYARVLASIEEWRVGHPAFGVAVSDGPLLTRIRRLVGPIDNREWCSRDSLLLTAAAMVVVGATAGVGVGAAQLNAQSLRKPPAFEVVSVKPFKPRSGADVNRPTFLPGRFLARAPLMMVIAAAYDIPFGRADLISGAPDWASSPDGVYDIEATPARDAGFERLSSSDRVAQERLMLQTLLAERFGLRVRRASKQMPVYVVTVARGGPKLAKAGIDERECVEPTADALSDPAAMVCHRFVGGRGRGLHATAASVTDLVKAVQAWTDRPVLDQTGIAGLYRIDTEPWQPMDVSTSRQLVDGVDAASLPTIFTIFDRLGLRLALQKRTVATYLIEHVERPTEN